MGAGNRKIAQNALHEARKEIQMLMRTVKRWSVLDTRRRPENQVYELVVFELEDKTMFLAKVEEKWTERNKKKAKSKFNPLLDLDFFEPQSFFVEVERLIQMLSEVGCVLKEVKNAGEYIAESPENS